MCIRDSTCKTAVAVRSAIRHFLVGLHSLVAAIAAGISAISYTHLRIYDRILERCAPILFDGKNFREENAGATRQTAKEIVNSKQD